MMQSCVRWLVAVGALSCSMTVLASPAVAYEIGKPSPSLICLTAKHAAEVGVEHLALEPANGATVPAGTSVAFSAEPLLKNAPTFSIASSSALLSSPDIDSGMGSQSGAFYRFTSTKATATPRTIYWTASFTFTPDECESPSTFTTPVRTLVVAPSEAVVKHSKTTTIGTATFSIPLGKTATIQVKLTAVGRSLFKAHHGYLSASLTVLKSSPAPSQTHTDTVHLAQQKAHGKAKK
jgi:hypothetical protein